MISPVAMLPSILAIGIFLQTLIPVLSTVSWEDWWTYDGISGPAFWGLINPEWSLCNKGRRQSPVNLDPEKLLYDPNLTELHVDRQRVDGMICNTGHSVMFYLENGTKNHINITGGPLSYKYQVYEIHIHYGQQDEMGSEHSINGYSFPAELQIFSFNSQLFANYSDAVQRSHGIVVLSLLLQLGDLSNPELRILTDHLDMIKYSGDEVPVKRLSVADLLPATHYYMTYDGSTTVPACHETVTWLILNKPIYITKQQLYSLRSLMQGSKKNQGMAPLGNNFRPPQPLHNRLVRTNIDFNLRKDDEKYCPSMHKDVYYKANDWKPH